MRTALFMSSSDEAFQNVAACIAKACEQLFSNQHKASLAGRVIDPTGYLVKFLNFLFSVNYTNLLQSLPYYLGMLTKCKVSLPFICGGGRPNLCRGKVLTGQLERKFLAFCMSMQHEKS